MREQWTAVYLLHECSFTDSSNIATNMYQGRPIGPAGFALANGMPRSDVPYATIPIVTSAPPTYVSTMAPGKMPLGPPPQSKSF